MDLGDDEQVQTASLASDLDNKAFTKVTLWPPVAETPTSLPEITDGDSIRPRYRFDVGRVPNRCQVSDGKYEPSVIRSRACILFFQSQSR